MEQNLQKAMAKRIAEARVELAKIEQMLEGMESLSNAGWGNVGDVGRIVTTLKEITENV